MKYVKDIAVKSIQMKKAQALRQKQARPETNRRDSCCAWSTRSQRNLVKDEARKRQDCIRMTQSQGHELRDHLSPWRTCWFTWRAWDYRYKPEEPEKPRDKTVSRNVKNEVSVNHLKRYRDTWGQERGYWMWQLGRC